MELNSCVNHLLKLTQQTVNQKMASVLEEYDISNGQYGVMSCLLTHKCITPKEMAHILRLETSTISGFLDKLQKRDLITRCIDTTDRRSVRVYLTPNGRTIAKDAVRRMHDIHCSILNDLPEEQRTNFLDCLRILANVSA